MNLEDFLSSTELLGQNYEKFLKLKNKLLKEGLPEHIAQYKASWILTPEKLERISILTKNEEGFK